jgi:hypothetical protein
MTTRNPAGSFSSQPPWSPRTIAVEPGDRIRPGGQDHRTVGIDCGVPGRVGDVRRAGWRIVATTRRPRSMKCRAISRPKPVEQPVTRSKLIRVLAVCCLETQGMEDGSGSEFAHEPPRAGAAEAPENTAPGAFHSDRRGDLRRDRSGSPGGRCRHAHHDARRDARRVCRHPVPVSSPKQALLFAIVERQLDTMASAMHVAGETVCGSGRRDRRRGACPRLARRQAGRCGRVTGDLRHCDRIRISGTSCSGGCAG